MKFINTDKISPRSTVSDISVTVDLPNEVKIQQEKEILITLHNNSEIPIFIMDLSVIYPYTFRKSEKTISLNPLKVTYPVWSEEIVLITDKTFPSYIEGYKDEKYYSYSGFSMPPFIYGTSIHYDQTNPSRGYFTIQPGQDLIIHIPIIGKIAKNYSGIISISGYAYHGNWDSKKFIHEESVDILIAP
ncbi:MAG: hypothetical protein AB9897_03430 [Anaerolineaceae bacterium]